ncbi:hypothetical protein CLOSTMETH_00785 [[Clostridium] methylpentosum DSM 5476]|uniref:Uncharacterized protein n=1 Tax=[Clostridium] methylpentosum DSM 5476 TaxID=537013 RepID=C0EAD1_9FIRM|nr:hypothetical protein CLOSTMETH_00785 [[Clostridium] methylpentosum DSM 5476]
MLKYRRSYNAQQKFSYRLGLNKVTVVEKPERPVLFKQLGSGSNWVGVHLIAYFALQRFLLTQIDQFQDSYSLITHRKFIFRLSWEKNR